MPHEHLGLNRYVCTVLEEMRNCMKTLNFAILPSLIEEVQTLVNRMEGKLHDVKDLETLHDRIKEKKKELNVLQKQIDENKAG